MSSVDWLAVSRLDTYLCHLDSRRNGYVLVIRLLSPARSQFVLNPAKLSYKPGIRINNNIIDPGSRLVGQFQTVQQAKSLKESLKRFRTV